MPAKTTPTSPTNIGSGKTALGTILVDSQGRTLYLFQADKGTTSACSGSCASAWPPLTPANGTATAGGGANASLLGSTMRSDGTQQVTYNGHPLYTFVGDHTRQVTGQGFQSFFVATPGLAPLTPSAAPAPSLSC